MERTKYETALEVGCSIGVFTRLLAPRCQRLIATEPSAAARAAAQDACADFPQVSFDGGRLPTGLPPGPFDLIVLSEVLYYLDEADAHIAARACCDRLEAGGETVLCHWLGETDYPLTGEDAAQLFVRHASERGFEARTLRRPEYRLDHIRAGGQS